jgi:UDP-GlcNAc:undecaprenyl-phosphate GlcNAc-1-phosphate transferase
MFENLCLLISFSISFSIVFFAVPKIIAVSHEKKLFDVPNSRSASKEKVIPNLGGIAIFAGFYISTIISLEGHDGTKIIGLLLVTVIMFLMGLQDDIIGLSASKKLFGQICVAVYLILVCNLRLTNLHGIFGIFEISYTLSFIVSSVAIIGLINAFNLIDGIDGLASGIGMLISAAYGFLFLYFNQMEYAIVSFSITGALVSFFFFNVFGTDNKIFMGDTGSLTLGVVFAILTIWFNEIIPTTGLDNLEWTSPAISLAIMIVPVVDSLRVIYIRILQGKSPFAPDMNHIHHQLIKLKDSHLHATISMMLANFLVICFAFSLIHLLENTVVFFLILAIGFSLAYLPVLALKFKKEAKPVYVFTNQDEVQHHLTKTFKNQGVTEISDDASKMPIVEDTSKKDQLPWDKIRNRIN